MDAMTPEIKSMLLYMLDNLQDMQSNAGCNDINLVPLLPDTEGLRRFMEDMCEGDERSPSDMGDGKYANNYMVTRYLTKWVRSQPVVTT